MDGDEPIGRDEMTEGVIPAEELVHVITESAIGQPTLEEEVVPVEEETPMTEEEKRKALYNSLADKMPIVQEVVGGLTTFREALDEIVYELGHPQENSEGIKQFGEYITALALLTGENRVGAGEMMDVINYETANSKETKGLVKKILGIGLGGSTASLIAGFIVKNEWARLILQSVGAGGLTTTGCIGLWYGTTQGIYTLKARKHFKQSYNIADTLDAEVQSLYFKEG